MTAMAVYGFEVYGAGIIGLFVLALGVYQLLLRSLLRGPRARRGDPSAAPTSSTFATRGWSACCSRRSPCATRAPPGTPRPSPTTRASSRARRGSASTSRRSRTPRGCCTTSARRRCPTTSCSAAASCTRPSGVWSSDIRPTARACCCASRGSARSRTRCSRTTSGSTATGYPDGLSGEDIPITARILAIAEVYDVLTAPDSYKIPLTSAEAEDELRRVAGSQLDGRLVWLFVTQVLRGTVVDHPGRMADLETELQVQRRMRGMLDQPLVLGPPAS